MSASNALTSRQRFALWLLGLLVFSVTAQSILSLPVVRLAVSVVIVLIALVFIVLLLAAVALFIGLLVRPNELESFLIARSTVVKALIAAFRAAP